MRTTLDCLPCYVRQALEAARITTQDAKVHERVLRQTLALIQGMDFEVSPPEVAKHIHALVRMVTGNPDPYREVKLRFNHVASQLLPQMERRVGESSRPFEIATRMAIAGNVIDFGIQAGLQENDVEQAVNEALRVPLNGSMERFEREVTNARSILYLADNTGEIVFDQLLLRRLPVERTTLAVRGAPTINDATLEDAQALGIPEWIRTITTGADVPGIVPRYCSAEFLEAYESADLIISKGQGNFESQDASPRNIYFLFKVKCAVVSKKVNQPLGSLMLLHGSERRDGKT